MSENKTPIVIALAGPVASGKSFITKRLDIRVENPIYINTDAIVKEMFGENPTQEQYNIGFAESDRRREEALHMRRNLIIFESPFSNPYKMDYLNQARNEGYFSRVYYVGTDDPEINVRRNESRRRVEKRGPSPEYVRKSWRDAHANMAITAKIAHECIVFNNSVDLAEEGVALFRTRDGLVVCRYIPELPRWALAAARKIGYQSGFDTPSDLLLSENLFLITHNIAVPPITKTPEKTAQLLGQRKEHSNLLRKIRNETGTLKERYRKAKGLDSSSFS